MSNCSCKEVITSFAFIGAAVGLGFDIHHAANRRDRHEEEEKPMLDKLQHRAMSMAGFMIGGTIGLGLAAGIIHVDNRFH